ncbi:MAG: Calx-beta domain-containing protein [Chloroflexota bacterium]
MHLIINRNVRPILISMCFSLFFVLGLLAVHVVSAATSYAPIEEQAPAPEAQDDDFCVATYDNGTSHWVGPNSEVIQYAIRDLEPLSDTVLVGGVCSGVSNILGMTQTIYISRSLNLIGGYTPEGFEVSLPNVTVIDAGCRGRALVIDGDIDVTLENFDIVCGNAGGLNGPIAENMGNGGGLLINGANVVLTNTRIYSSSADNGGGAFVGSTLTLGVGSVVSNNVAFNGGGVYVNSTAATSALILDGGEIISNFAIIDGGGVYIDDVTAVYTQTSGIIGYNQAVRDGGGLYVKEGQTTLLGGQVISNTALEFEGGGIYMDTITGTLFISNTQILYNSADLDDGGGITTKGGMTLINSEVAHNFAFWVGGGIDNDDMGKTLIVDSYIHHNIGEEEGGGIDSDAPLEIRNTRIISNETTYVGPDGGGGIHSSDRLTITGSVIDNNRTVGRGGGLYLTGGLTETVLISDTQITNNFAVGDGGGLRSRTTLTVISSTIASNTSMEDGGGIDEDGSTVTIRDSLIQFNSAVEDGGGIEINTELTIENSTVYSNVASYMGGGIWSEGQITITQSIISNNEVITPTGAGGGVANVYGGQLTLVDSQIRDNSADNGGGISNFDASMTIDGSEVGNNQAAFGAGLYNSAISGTLSITNTTISGNNASSETGGIRNSAFNGIQGVYAYTEAGMINLFHVTLNENVSANAMDHNVLNSDGGTINIERSILSVTSGANCFNGTSFFNSLGGNIYSDMSCGTADPTDLTVTNPLLMPLADNGGPLLPNGTAPRTHALDPVSPAVDFVSCELTVDQRNEPRPGSTIQCDSGSYEAQEIAVDVSIEKTVSPAIAKPGETITYTIAFSNTGNANAQNLAITDLIPAEISVSAVVSSGVNITQTGTAPYQWTVSQLGLADSGIITVTGMISPDLTADLTILNTAAITATNDFTATNNSSLASLSVALPRVQLDSSTYVVNEGVGTATVTVTLDMANSYRDVTVSYATSPGTATDGSDYTGNANTLLIPAGSTLATFTVTITDDQVVEIDETLDVTLSMPVGAILDTPSSATVTIVDNDVATLSIDDVVRDEGNSGTTFFTFTVTLDQAVDMGFTVPVSTSADTASSGSDYTDVNTMIAFVGGAGETQRVTVIVAGDAEVEPDEIFLVSLGAFDSNGRNVSLLDADGLGTIRNDDVGAIVLAPTILTLSEPSSTGSASIRLLSQPSAPVTINLTTSDATECTIPGSIVLDSSNWQSGISFTITAVDDDLDDGSQPCVMQATATSSDPTYDGAPIEDLNVTVQDDDGAGVLFSTLALAVSEPGTTDSTIVRLTSEPTSPVTINLTAADATECTVPATVELDATTWQSGVSITVMAVDDNVVDDSQSCLVQTMVTSSDPVYNGIGADDLAVTVADDDTAGILTTPSALSISEPATTATFTITLSSEPTDTVTINLTVSDASECTVPASAVLNASNRQNGIPIIVTALDDDLVDGTQSCNVSFTAVSADANYNGSTLTPVNVSVADDDTVNLAPIIADQSFTVDENSPIDTNIGTVVASDPDIGQTVTFSILTINESPLLVRRLQEGSEGSTLFEVAPTTGMLTVNGGPLDFETVNRYQLNIQVSDSGNPVQSASATVTINLQDVNEPPVVVNPTAPQSVGAQAIFNYTLDPNTFADIDIGDTLTLAATLGDGSPLPNWLFFEPASATFTGTPTETANLTIRVTATDTGSLQAATTFTLTVTEGPTDLEEVEEPDQVDEIFLPVLVK